LRRDDVEPLGGLLADDMHRAPAARAGGVLRGEHHLDARQMGGQRSARLGATRRAPLRCRIVLLLLGLEAGDGLLDVLQGELQLSLSELRPKRARCNWRRM